jgi:vacuolar-type H+-ATPase subunit I/STV1
MTGEEMERAIEFLINNQARIEARLDARFEETNQQIAETNRQLAQTNQRLEAFAESQAQLIQVVTRTFDAQNRINEESRRWQEESQRLQEAAWAAIRQTEKTVDRLAETVRRQIEGRNGNSGG